MRRPLTATVIALAIAAASAVIYATNQRGTGGWEAYKVAHSCHAVATAHVDPTTLPPSLGSTRVGKIIGTSPTTPWLCDDGVIYWK